MGVVKKKSENVDKEIEKLHKMIRRSKNKEFKKMGVEPPWGSERDITKNKAKKKRKDVTNSQIRTGVMVTNKRIGKLIRENKELRNDIKNINKLMNKVLNDATKGDSPKNPRGNEALQKILRKYQTNKRSE